MAEQDIPTVDEVRDVWVANGGKALDFNKLVQQLENRAAVKNQERIIKGLNKIHKHKVEMFGEHSRYVLTNIRTLVHEIETGFTG